MPSAKLSSERRQGKRNPWGKTRGANREAKQGTPPPGRYLIPGTDEWVNYATYREKTGTCETCGAPMASHPECEGCGILCGEGHLASLSPYRGHDLCRYCIRLWRSQERAVGRETTWEEFRSPKLSLFER